ncbi:MAG: hypothetical protein LCH41_14130 [Armatimonadetes bacterium]|nr:hypothetical protein [Armatimonadota bacterium]
MIALIISLGWILLYFLATLAVLMAGLFAAIYCWGIGPRWFGYRLKFRVAKKMFIDDGMAHYVGNFDNLPPGARRYLIVREESGKERTFLALTAAAADVAVGQECVAFLIGARIIEITWKEPWPGA